MSRDDVKRDEIEKVNETDRSHLLYWTFRNSNLISSSWLSAPSEHIPPTGSRSEYRRNELLNRAGDIYSHPGPNRALSSRGRRIPVQDILPDVGR